MEWGPQEENTILFCPKCGYTPYEKDYLNLQSTKEIYSLSVQPTEETFVCTQCHYSGKLFSIPESDRYKMEFDLDELEAPLRQARKSSKRFYLYILGGLAIIAVVLQTSNLALSAVLALALAALIVYLELRARA